MRSDKTIVQDGVAEDLIRSFVQFSCAEGHIKTLLEKYTAELENGIIDVENADVVEKQMEKIGDLEEELTDLSELRRGIMLRLFNMYEGDKDFWCLAKHVGTGAYNLFEAWCASDDDNELYEMYLRANRRFVKVMTHFLGMEITECAACFADALRTKGDN